MKSNFSIISGAGGSSSISLRGFGKHLGGPQECHGCDGRCHTSIKNPGLGWWGLYYPHRQGNDPNAWEFYWILTSIVTDFPEWHIRHQVKRRRSNDSHECGLNSILKLGSIKQWALGTCNQIQRMYMTDVWFGTFFSPYVGKFIIPIDEL